MNGWKYRVLHPCGASAGQWFDRKQDAIEDARTGGQRHKFWTWVQLYRTGYRIEKFNAEVSERAAKGSFAAPDGWAQFVSKYMGSVDSVAPACPRCERGQLREHKLGKICVGCVGVGAEPCGYRSWRLHNATRTDACGGRRVRMDLSDHAARCMAPDWLPSGRVEFDPSIPDSVDLLLGEYGPEGLYAIAAVLTRAADAHQALREQEGV